MKLCVVAVIIWIYCILSNTYWWIQSKMLYKRFESEKEMTTYIPAVDEIFRKAGTTYQTYYDENKGGYRQRSLVDVSYLCDKAKYHAEVKKVFGVTIGTFRQRLKHSIFPIHLVFYPSYLLMQTEKQVNSVFRFVLTILYWCIGAIAGYHLEALLNFLYLEHLQKLFERLL